MPLVGSANVKYEKAIDMDGCLANILRPFNSSTTLILQKINELNGVKSRGNYDVIKDLNGTYNKLGYKNADEEEEAQDQMVAIMKRGYVLKNIMGVISKMSSYQDKVICLIYLITEAQLLSSNPDDFRLLDDFPTDYDYILADNKDINKVIESIKVDILKLDDQLSDLKAKFKASVDDEVSAEIFSYPATAFMTTSTTTFFRAVKRRIGERYTKEVQEQISEFLKNYKKAIKAATRGNVKSYCQKFRINPSMYNQDNILKAMQPVDGLDIWT